MTEQGDHEAKAEEVERSLDEMQERSGRLEGEIEGAGEDWESKQRDPAVPGAAGDSDDESEAGGPDPPPEAREPPD